MINWIELMVRQFEVDLSKKDKRQRQTSICVNSRYDMIRSVTVTVKAVVPALIDTPALLENLISFCYELLSLLIKG